MNTETLLRSKLKAYQSKDDIRRLHALGHSDGEISKVLRIPEPQIVAQREALRLPNRYSQGIYYSDEDDEAIIDLRDNKSFRWTEISKKLEDKFTPFNIQMRYRYLDGLRTRISKNGEPSQRNCNRCGETFLSEGRHNHSCDRCRNNEVNDVDHYCVVHAPGNWD